MEKKTTTAPAHTAGPWTIAKDKSFILGPKKLVLVHFYSIGSDGVGAANARLIAAAPELLEELKEARSAIQDFYGVDSAEAGQHFGLTMLERMNVLIAKAEGG